MKERFNIVCGLWWTSNADGSIDFVIKRPFLFFFSKKIRIPYQKVRFAASNDPTRAYAVVLDDPSGGLVEYYVFLPERKLLSGTETLREAPKGTQLIWSFAQKYPSFDRTFGCFGRAYGCFGGEYYENGTRMLALNLGENEILSTAVGRCVFEAHNMSLNRATNENSEGGYDILVGLPFRHFTKYYPDCTW